SPSLKTSQSTVNCQLSTVNKAPWRLLYEKKPVTFDIGAKYTMRYKAQFSWAQCYKAQERLIYLRKAMSYFGDRHDRFCGFSFQCYKSF
ncbi:MAG: hypothetical protein ACMG55_18565, partial [Microcoleus sp.]